MEIESIKVIPTRKDSIFEENALNTFDCTITTSYEDWKASFDQEVATYTSEMNKHDLGDLSKLNPPPPEFDSVCEDFAKSQKAYMTEPTAIFHDKVYVARTAYFENADDLMPMTNFGPLYRVEKEYYSDTKSGLTEERHYVDPITFMPMYGPWYPIKTRYRIRYGIRIE